MIRTYYFEFSDPDKDFYCTVGKDSKDGVTNEKTIAPEWTRLSCHQCPHCQLSANTQAYCPPALDMLNLVEHFSTCSSCEIVTLHAIIGSQRHSIRTDLQSALAYLFPLIAAYSLCPYASLLRPLEKFAKPFPNNDDVLFHMLAISLVRNYLRQHSAGTEPDTFLSDDDVISNVADVLQGLLQRLRMASENDANINAIIKNIQWTFTLLYDRQNIINHLKRFFVLEKPTA